MSNNLHIRRNDTLSPISRVRYHMEGFDNEFINADHGIVSLIVKEIRNSVKSERSEEIKEECDLILAKLAGVKTNLDLSEIKRSNQLGAIIDIGVSEIERFSSGLQFNMSMLFFCESVAKQAYGEETDSNKPARDQLNASGDDRLVFIDAFYKPLSSGTFPSSPSCADQDQWPDDGKNIWGIALESLRDRLMVDQDD